jgi:hepatitis B virus X-interacting protein
MLRNGLLVSLFLLAKGQISDKSAGTIVAISEYASKLDPNCNTPVISLEIDNKYVIRLVLLH